MYLYLLTLKEGWSKIIPSFFTIKEGSTSHLGLLPSGKKKETALLGTDFSTSPSLLQGELHFLPKPLFLRKRGCNRPTRCSEPLRSKVGGPSKVFAILCGMGPPGDCLMMTIARLCGMGPRGKRVYNLQLIVYSLMGGTTIFVPHCSIALHWSSLE